MWLEGSRDKEARGFRDRLGRRKGQDAPREGEGEIRNEMNWIVG